MIRVVIADDHTIMREGLKRILLGVDDIEVVGEAADGFEGLLQLGNGNAIDLILSDINMPNMDGLDFVTAVREQGYKMPIVMLTTEGGEDVIKEAIDRGANASIKKPFTPEQLKEYLEGYL
jgi:two-component system chemotaxis response regulator CheY